MHHTFLVFSNVKFSEGPVYLKKTRTSNIKEKIGAFLPHCFPSFLVHWRNRDEEVGEI